MAKYICGSANIPVPTWYKGKMRTYSKLTKDGEACMANIYIDMTPDHKLLRR